MSCRLWPTAHSFQPAILDSVTTAVVEYLTSSQCKVFWIPKADSQPTDSSLCSGSNGEWVSLGEACFLPTEGAPVKGVVKVARRAGLNIPEVPDHILKVSLAVCTANLLVTW